MVDAKKKFINNLNNTNKFSRRGDSIYFYGSMLFVIGMILIALGVSFVMIFQIHYGIDFEKVLITTTSIGMGITFVLMGINLMIRQTKKGYYIVGIGLIISIAATIFFILNYGNNWYYPVISYVLGMYICGFLLLIGNAFGNATLWLIENKPQTELEETRVMKSYTDEEIQRDIEEATKKSMAAAADDLQLEFDISNSLHIQKMSDRSGGAVTRVKDDMMEIKTLHQTVRPGEVEHWGSVGVEKESSKLADILLQQQSEQGVVRTLWQRFVHRLGFH